MPNFTPEQLQMIQELNNLPVHPDCRECGGGGTCWLATQAASDLLAQLEGMPTGHSGCLNREIVAEKVAAIQALFNQEQDVTS